MFRLEYGRIVKSRNVPCQQQQFLPLKLFNLSFTFSFSASKKVCIPKFLFKNNGILLVFVKNHHFKLSKTKFVIEGLLGHQSIVLIIFMSLYSIKYSSYYLKICTSCFFQIKLLLAENANNVNKH